jgi:DNA-binding transcriptional MerR regulator
VQYTIKKAAEKMGVSIPTLRYYDKEGLLPFIEKKPNGTRIFKDDDFQTLSLINCLKKAGVSIKEIRKYIRLCEEGDSTLNERLEIFLERKKDVLRQMSELQEVLDTIEHKIDYYQNAISEGTEKLHNLSKK